MNAQSALNLQFFVMIEARQRKQGKLQNPCSRCGLQAFRGGEMYALLFALQYSQP
jgi:hypothetical protein